MREEAAAAAAILFSRAIRSMVRGSATGRIGIPRTRLWPHNSLAVSRSNHSMALFEKASSFRSEPSERTPREGVPPVSSPLGGFLNRLGINGGAEFSNRIAGSQSSTGAARASYFQPDQSVQPQPSSPAPLRRTASPRANNGGRSPAPPKQRAAAATPKRSAAAEAHAAAAQARKERIREREAAQAELEQQQRLKTETDKVAATEAAAAIAERKRRIEERKAAEAAGSDGSLSSARGGNTNKRAKLSDEERQKEQLRVEQQKRLKEAEREEKEKAREAQLQRAQQQAIKKKEQEEAAERKQAALREKAEARQRENEAKRERARLAKLEQLEKHKEKSAKALAKANRDPSNEWWCDVALEGCCRPVKGNYPPETYHCCGTEYLVCTECYLNHLTEEQQQELETVER